ncbi:MAG: c-type cytochrome [Saprospiraceae bacterium]|nr:c-type cytochrome [Saprospiraceae bacterium]
MRYYLSLLSLLAGMLFLACQSSDTEPRREAPKTKPQPITVPAGYVVDSIYSPSTHEQGSWVALAEGENGRYYASDQFGRLYSFIMPAIGEHLDPTAVDSIDLNIGHAHGLIWAFNSLYVAVNLDWEREQYSYGSGVYRLTDRSGDGQLDHVELLMQLEGDGEHGPHSFVVSPDGNRLYFIAGNHTLIPEEIASNSRLPNNWDEDNLIPPYLDARGHANDIKAPGGWVASFDPDGTDWELHAAGFRNAFDMGFNKDGELFVFDADMEWDIGMPWYRPIRVCHATSGAEFGWRTGTGKWPAYFPDNLPAVVDLGQGSPTAVVMGKDLAFGAEYSQGLFAVDWSFGTMYYVDLVPEGSSYSGSKSEFLSGAPLPLTDVIATSSGEMVFAVGGRRLQSALYRVRYTGPSTESTTTESEEAQNLRALRHSLEELHTSSSGGIAQAWNQLNHEDRHIRYAARIALEHRSPSQWVSRFRNARDAQTVIEGALALARSDDDGYKDVVLRKLLAVNTAKLTAMQKIGIARAMQLSLLRLGDPDPSLKADLTDQLLSMFPSDDPAINRAISPILIHLEVPQATAMCVALMKSHTEKGTSTDGLISSEVTARSARYGPAIEDVIKYTPPSEAIYYAMLLSHVSEGWTPELREDYFQWYFDVMGAKGGLSFKAFMENARQKALTHVPETDRERFDELSGVYNPGADLADLPQPVGPGGTYNQGQLNKLLRENLNEDYRGEFANAKRTYEAALCAACHRMHGEGGIIGPDLTQINTRFNRWEILGAIISPHDEISDQYAFTLFEKEDGSKVAGRIASEDDDKVVIMPNPYTSTYKVEIAKADIVERGLSPVSPMPPGLLNRLNKDEILDLIAYLVSGGDDDHEYFTGNSSD